MLPKDAEDDDAGQAEQHGQDVARDVDQQHTQVLLKLESIS